MQLLSGADMVVRSLASEGVEYIYGYPGGALLHVYDAIFRQDAITHILVRHEQAATHMADGYARVTGKAGVALVTSGPGATNTITGIATAYMDSIPMVVLSGQVPSGFIGSDMFQEVDMVGISRPIVKHSFLVKRAEDIPVTIKKAFYLAQTGRPGPVVVDLPKDITDIAHKYHYSYPETVSVRSYTPPTKGHTGQIRKAVALLMNARRPIIYSGGGVILDKASGLLTRLAKELNMPVTNTLMGLGGFPGTDPQFIGMLGMHGSYCANQAMHNADLILALGVRFDDRVTSNLKKFCPHAKIIHVDIDPASIAKNVPVDIPIVGPVGVVIEGMLSQINASGKQLDPEAMDSWWDQLNDWKQHRGGLFSYEKDEQGLVLKPQQVIETLYDITGGDAYVTSDVGQHQMFTAQYYLFDKPNRWINSGGLGTMGFGLPAAMAIKLSFPDAEVVCVTGEGSIQMNIQELSTCLQYDLNIKIINLNNRALGMVRQWQDMQYSSRYSHSYMESLPDFVKLAESYGHAGIRVTDPKELAPAMKEAFSLKDRLVFMDIQVDPDEHVYPMQMKDGAMNDMWLSKTEKT
ncbi:acetolactate synthase 3 large subunit [Candidatus Sororendozoicomonas aggregata]|uniref:acetolactate synthase 3 large subunit n=1 Tax=Candidatus Sororendozoicomonas aggregata TaxID=3073239 RepID=UPI002ED0205C